MRKMAYEISSGLRKDDRRKSLPARLLLQARVSLKRLTGKVVSGTRHGALAAFFPAKRRGNWSGSLQTVGLLEWPAPKHYAAPALAPRALVCAGLPVRRSPYALR